MPRHCVLLAVFLLVASPVAATLFPAIDHVERVETNGHPKKGRFEVVVAEAIPGTVRGCIEYGSTIPRVEGRIKVQLRVVRDGRAIEKASFAGPVEAREHLPDVDGTAYYGCTGEIESRLATGDRLVFLVRYKGFPPKEELRPNDLLVLTAGVTR